MITLLTLTKYTDDRYAARWLDDEYGLHFEFNALHDGTGKPVAVNREGKAPALTAEQLSTAQPFQEPAPIQHPAYELAAKGTAVRPEWGKRYTKAAQLVEAGHVRLTGPETAVVTGDTDAYDVIGAGKDAHCRCRWGEFNSEPCSHIMAMRMARALGQAIESPMAHGIKRTISVDDMWTSIYRQQNKARSRQRRYGRQPRWQRAGAGVGGD